MDPNDQQQQQQQQQYQYRLLAHSPHVVATAATAYTAGDATGPPLASPQPVSPSQQQLEYAAYMMAVQQQQQQQYALYVHQQQQQQQQRYEAAVRAEQEERTREIQHQQTLAALAAQQQQQQQLVLQQQHQHHHHQQQQQQQQQEQKRQQERLRETERAVSAVPSTSPLIATAALSVSVPSSSSSTPAPSAPPSVRSLTSADPASAHLDSFSEFVCAFTSSYSASSLDRIPFCDRSSSAPVDWLTLFRQLRMCAAKGVLAQVEAGLLAELLPFLLAAMDEACTVSLLRPPDGIDPSQLQCVLRGLDALLMTMYIITQRGIARTLLREDMLEAAVQLLVQCVKRNVLPVLDPGVRDRVGKDREKEQMKEEAVDEVVVEEDDAEQAADGHKRTASLGSTTAATIADSGWWTFAESTTKDVLKKVELAITLLDTYVRNEVTRDMQLLPLIDLCFVIVAAEHCQKLQTAVLPLVSAIFMQGDEARRVAMLDSLVGCFRSCASKRLQRSYPLHYKPSSSFRSKFSPLAAASGEDSHGLSAVAHKGSIQTLVALLLLLVQSIAGSSLPATLQLDGLLGELLSPNGSASTPSSTAVTAASSSHGAAQSTAFALAVRDLHAASVKASWQFVCSFLERLQPNASTVVSLKASQQCIRAVLDDLLLVLFLPEWPAAEQLLHCFVLRLCALLDAPRADKLGNSGDRMQQLCISLVGVVCEQLKAHEVQVSRAPMAIRPHRQVDDTVQASPHNLSEVTDCICGFRQVGTWSGDVAMEDGGEAVTPLPSPTKAEDGGLFLDCDSCHVWFHGTCVGFSSQQEVEAAGSWVCESCMLRRAVDEQAEDMQRRAVVRQAVEVPQAIELEPQPPQLLKQDDKDDSGEAMEGEPSHSATCIASAEVAGERVLKQLLVNYLTDLCHSSARDGVWFARQFHLSRWMAAVVREEERALQNMASAAALSTALLVNPGLRFCLINWSLPVKSHHATSSSPLLSREGQFRLSRQLSSRHELCQSFAVLLSKLLDKCTDTQPVFRAKAVSALSHTVKVEPALLKNDAVREALLARVLDPSTSTRDAVLELIGGQLRYEPTALDEYFDTVVSRIHDVGISVRKRVVRILHDVMLHPGLRDREKIRTHYVRVVGLLIERLRDEDTVQRLVRDTFKRLWFDDTDERIRGRRISQAYADMVDRLDVGRQAASLDGKSAFSSDFHLLVRRVQSCVSEVSRVNGIDSLMSIVQQLMQAQESKSAPSAARTKKSAGRRLDSNEVSVTDAKQFSHSVRAICGDMCSCIVEELVALETACSDKDVSGQRLAAVLTLHLFTRIHPSFLVPHVYTLGPYLAQHTDKALTAQLEPLVSIVSEILPLVRNPSTSLLDNMLKSLMHIVLQTSSPSLIAAAVPCLVVLTAIPGMQHKRDELLKLALRFHSFLNNRKPTARMEAVPEEGNVIRSLLALGLLYKNVDVDEHSSKLAVTEKRSQGKTSTYPPIDAVFELYNCFVRHSPPRVTIFALKGVIALFTRRPTLISRSTQLLQRALGDHGTAADSSNAELQVCALQCLRLFLQSEDARLQRAQKIDQQRAKEDENKVRSQRRAANGTMAAEDESEDGEEEATTAVMDAVNSLHDFHGKKGWSVHTTDSHPSQPPRHSDHGVCACFCDARLNSCCCLPALPVCR